MRARQVFLAGAVVFASAAMAGRHPLRAEEQLRRVFDTVAQGRLNDALREADRLVASYPNFRLAHLVRGKPVMVGAASMGDRAQVAFAEPGEISKFIRTKCE